MSITGPPGAGPIRAGIAVSDSAAGHQLALGIMIALHDRERTGPRAVGEGVAARGDDLVPRLPGRALHDRRARPGDRGQPPPDGCGRWARTARPTATSTSPRPASGSGAGCATCSTTPRWRPTSASPRRGCATTNRLELDAALDERLGGAHPRRVDRPARRRRHPVRSGQRDRRGVRRPAGAAPGDAGDRRPRHPGPGRRAAQPDHHVAQRARRADGGADAGRRPGRRARRPRHPARRPDQSGRALAQALRVAAPLLRVEAPLLRATGRLRRPARRGRRLDRGGDEVGEARRRRLPVAQLRAALGRRHGDRAVDERGRRAAGGPAPAAARSSALERSRSHVSSTRESVVLTCWPPAPDEREKRHVSSAAGMVTVGPTRTSSMPALYQPGTKWRSNSSRPWSCVEMPGRARVLDAVVGEHDVGAADDLDRVAVLLGLDVERHRVRRALQREVAGRRRRDRRRRRPARCRGRSARSARRSPSGSSSVSMQAAAELVVATVLVARDGRHVDLEVGRRDLRPVERQAAGDRARAADALGVLAEQDLDDPVADGARRRRRSSTCVAAGCRRGGRRRRGGCRSSPALVAPGAARRRRGRRAGGRRRPSRRGASSSAKRSGGSSLMKLM